ncbi:hypothetical protein DV515_00007499 [Chloebia gouldiae]|uniref:Uncharacterized protein n=1 Tax=Chloebia gouldiae TaxID=44316 RepID=A0A3L8SH40_CHLGU|nr:hypothetical protein DV515_00007499 [Chloebia gouldiae]
MMETQPSTENASSKAGAEKASCFQKPLLRQFPFLRRRQEANFPVLTTYVEDISTIGLLMLPLLSYQDHYPKVLAAASGEYVFVNPEPEGTSGILPYLTGYHAIYQQQQQISAE